MCIDCGPLCGTGDAQRARPTDSALPPAVVDHHLHIQGPEVSAELRRRAALFPHDFAIFAPALFDTRSGDDALATLDQAGIGEGVLLSMAYTFASPRATMHADAALVARLTRDENRYNVEAALASGGRLHACIGINPLADNALDELGYWAGRDGVTGLKLHLGNSGYRHDAPDQVAKLAAVFAAARVAALPVVVHVRSGANFPATETAQFIEQVLPHAGELPVQIAHAGGGGGLDEETLAALAQYAEAIERGAAGTAHLLFDLSVVLVRDITDAASASLVTGLVALVRRIGPQRFLMGSDWPTICAPRDHNAMQTEQMTLCDDEWRLILANRAPYLPQPAGADTDANAATGTGRRIATSIEHWPYIRPFHITGHVFDGSDALIVRVAEGPYQGRGEAAGVYYHGETAGSMAAQIAAVGTAAATASRADLLSLMGPGGARNGLDCALWDLEAQRAGRPVWQLAGLSRVVPLLTTYTIGAGDPGEMAARALTFGPARALKLKLLGDGGDAERVRAVRQARPEVWLGVDANQGFTPDSYHALLPALLAARVQLVEQPFAIGREADLDGLQSPILLAADESVQDRHDLDRVIGRVGVVNIKLDKCGGLTEALAMVALIRGAGMQVMVGNMVGTSLSAAPGFVLGQFCDFVDLDGPMFLTRDRQPAISYDDGLIVCPDAVWGSGA